MPGDHEGFDKLLTMFIYCRDNIYVSESECGSEIDCFQGSHLNCLHVQVDYIWLGTMETP